MKKYIHWLVLLIGGFISVFLFSSWENFFGYLGFLFYFVWNIYAFINGKNMISLPKMIENVKFNGSHDARVFLFVFSLIMVLIIFAGYIYKGATS